MRDIPEFASLIKLVTAKSYVISANIRKLTQAVNRCIFCLSMSPDSQNHRVTNFTSASFP
jgi:hypothetical protein